MILSLTSSVMGEQIFSRAEIILLEDGMYIVKTDMGMSQSESSSLMMSNTSCPGREASSDSGKEIDVMHFSVYTLVNFRRPFLRISSSVRSLSSVPVGNRSIPLVGV